MYELKVTQRIYKGKISNFKTFSVCSYVCSLLLAMSHRELKFSVFHSSYKILNPRRKNEECQIKTMKERSKCFES